MVSAATSDERPLGSRIARCGSVASAPHAGGMLLVDVGAGRRIRLDELGGRVWTQLAGRPTLPALVVGLRDGATPAERLAEDVVRLLDHWCRRGVIRWG